MSLKISRKSELGKMGTGGKVLSLFLTIHYSHYSELYRSAFKNQTSGFNRTVRKKAVGLCKAYILLQFYFFFPF